MQKIVDGVLVDMTQEEIEARLAEEAAYEAGRFDREAASVRDSRGRLLQESDWVVAKSYERGEPVPSDWASYRQALRDITAQAGFPYSVVWPTKP